MRIDEKTVLPIAWVFSGFAAVISITAVIAFYVSNLNYRLERIEQKLGIPAYTSGIPFFDAEASEGKPSNANGK